MSGPPPSPLSDLYARENAHLAEYHGGLLPRYFSDPVAEHLAVRRHAGLFDYSFRAHLALTGDDRAKFLHRIVSQDIRNVAPGHGTYSTLLNPQGHILADFCVYSTDDRLLIDTDADLRDKLTQGLRKYIIADKVQVESRDTAAIAIQGPESLGIIKKALQSELHLAKEHDHATSHLAGLSVRILRAGSTGEEGYEIWVARQHLERAWKLLRETAGPAGATAFCCGVTALETLRIEAGIARYGSDMGEDTILNEAALFNAVSFNKGCYIGQEIVERARSRGHVNWKLMGVVVDSASPPQPGEKLLAGSKEIGEITSACVSPTLGKTIALAYLRREASEPGTDVLLASGVQAEVTSLPFYSRS